MMTPELIDTAAPAISSSILPTWIKSAIFWLTAVSPLLLAGLVWGVVADRWRWVCAVAIPPVALGVYARHIEPRVLLVSEHAVEVCGGGLPGTLRAAVVSDFHYGIFGNAMPMDRIVRKLNGLDVDLVLIPGDFTLYPEAGALPRHLAALSDAEMPVYAAFGNHDVGIPGPDLTEPLTAALEGAGVTVLNPGEAVFEAEGKFLRVVGQRDLWDSQFRGLPLGVVEPSPMATIVIQHNPDALLEEDLGPFDLLVSGHTHGGQINLPWITCAMTFACDTLRYGFADTPAGKLFVTSGTGMTGLPVRLGVPPKIDVLNLTLDRCRPDYGPPGATL